MYIGHYAVSFAGKQADARIPLWMLVLAVQFLDIVWSVLVLLGIERARIVPHFTASNPLDLFYMPFTHSLPGALFWSLLVYLAVRFLPLVRGAARAAPQGRAGLVLGAAVFSHWLFDVLVHTPDLLLWGDLKIGLGIWQNLPATLALETLLLLAGVGLYARAAKPASVRAWAGLAALTLVMLALDFANYLGAPPSSTRMVAVVALASYLAFGLLAYWMERAAGRAGRSVPAAR
ncbi:MAG TPA: hypothetical protein VF171_06915 [Trueperaceae bacterium]